MDPVAMQCERNNGFTSGSETREDPAVPFVVGASSQMSSPTSHTKPMLTRETSDVAKAPLFVGFDDIWRVIGGTKGSLTFSIRLNGIRNEIRGHLDGRRNGFIGIIIRSEK